MKNKNTGHDRMVVGFTTTYAGAAPGFQVRGGALIHFWGVFRVKIHDFTPKKQITESPSYP
jgi:hypothetical protein